MIFCFLVVVTKCYDDFCGGTGATTSFCKCWNAGQDISVQTCACVPLNLDALCAAVDPSKIDVPNCNCSAAGDAVSHICN